MMMMLFCRCVNSSLKQSKKVSLSEWIPLIQIHTLNNSHTFCWDFLLGLYGWFWVCPNGGDKCFYRHCLPPGFILKKDKKAMEDQKEEISMEELIESEVRVWSFCVVCVDV